MAYFRFQIFIFSFFLSSPCFSQDSKTQEKAVTDSVTSVATPSKESSALTETPENSKNTKTAVVLEKTTPKTYNHSGFVAYFGPVYFKESFAVDSEVVNSLSVVKGFSAGFSIEYQMKYASFNFDFGIVGGYYSLTTTDQSYSSSGITLGGMLKPSLLFRLGPVEVGPICPLLFRYASFKRPPTGELGTENFVPYFAAGAIVKYDFGQTRLAVHYSRISLDNPIAAVELQFEL